jgi:hypothetical protein
MNLELVRIKKDVAAAGMKVSYLNPDGFVHVDVEHPIRTSHSISKTQTK